MCLIAPTIQHRIEFRRQDKAHIVKVANQLAIVGLTFLAIAMIGAILLVTDVLFSKTMSIISAGFVALAFAVLWYAIPLQRLRHRRRAD